jgi:hypothetical protein
MSNNPFVPFSNEELPFGNNIEIDILKTLEGDNDDNNPDKILIKNVQESIEKFKKKHLMDQATILQLTQQYNSLNNAYSTLTQQYTQLSLTYNYLNSACTHLNEEYNRLKIEHDSYLSGKERKMFGGNNKMKAKNRLNGKSKKTKKKYNQK